MDAELAVWGGGASLVSESWPRSLTRRDGAALAGPVEMSLQRAVHQTATVADRLTDDALLGFLVRHNQRLDNDRRHGRHELFAGPECGRNSMDLEQLHGDIRQRWQDCSKDSLTITPSSATGLSQRPSNANRFLMGFSGNVHGGQDDRASSYSDTGNSLFSDSSSSTVNDCSKASLIHTLTLGDGTEEQLRSGHPGPVRCLFTDRGWNTFSAGLSSDP